MTSAAGDGVRAYVPLRKKLRSAHTGEETNFVAPYSAAHSGGNAATAETQQQEEDANAQQEASWSRLEHGIAIADGNDAPHVIQSFEKMGLPSSVLRYVHGYLCSSS